MYDGNWNEKVIKLKIEPKDEYSHEAYFTQNFIFKRSGTGKRLTANANGVTSQVFEGCRFKAEKYRIILVDISGGTLINKNRFSVFNNKGYKIKCMLIIIFLSF